MKIDLTKSIWNETEESKHFIFYSNGKNVSRIEIDKCENKFNEILSTFKLENEAFKIKYYFCPNLEIVKAITGRKSYGDADLQKKIILSYYAYQPHEIVHHVIYQNIGFYNNLVIDEGLAVLFGSFDDGEAQWRGKTLSYWKKINKLKYKITNQNLIKNFNNIDQKTSYPLSAIYVQNLINKLGVSKFIELYRAKKLF